ncbi:MAG: ABC transporter permease [Herbinix sp.]|nr:ABC transporter permease [Herbinix sp.]
MRISDLFVMGLKNLSRRKARTILTILGVIIGSLSIIIMISIGNGMNSNFNSQVMQQGSLTTVTVNSMADIFDEDNQYVSSKEQALNDNLVEQIKALEHVRAVSPIIQAYVSLTAGKYMSNVSIMAMNMDTFEDFDFPTLQYGEYPTQEDNSAIIFGFSQPYAFYNPNSRNYQEVQVDLQKQKVILKFQDYQVAPKKKEFTLPLKNIAKMVQTNSEFDYYTYMDINYFKKIFREYCNTLSLQDRKKALKTIQSYNQIKLNVDNINNVEKVQDDIEKLGFTSFSMLQYLLPLQDASKTLQMVLGALGFVSMLASAISIANTMVMSIYERTKEIGIMKVLGCTIKDIRKLFLFEAGMIGLFGGIIGIVFGYIASYVVNKFGGPIFQALMSGNYMYDTTNTRFSIIPLYLPIASLGISILVGLVSGYFPARRATKISAIEAMKTEG